MKYIRTKDNAIYKIENNKLIVGNIKVDCKDLQALEQEDYKIADTIEELCDRFIAKTCDITEYWVEQKLECAKMYCGVETIYGAIWTDKGLIYVAKMNENGDLLLL